MQAEQQRLHKMLSIYVEQLREKPSLGYVRLTMVEAERLIAALSHPSPQGWQDIESAPKDGEFLVYMPNERAKIQAARWHPNVKTIGGNFHFDLSKPTHWRPYPPPPEQRGKG